MWFVRSYLAAGYCSESVRASSSFSSSSPSAPAWDGRSWSASRPASAASAWSFSRAFSDCSPSAISREKLSRRALYGLVLGFAAVALLVWSVNHALFPELVPLGQLGRFACVWGVAFAFFFTLLEARHREMPKFACWLGRRSYPIYLLHPLALLLLSSTGWPAWAFMPSLFGLTLAARGPDPCLHRAAGNRFRAAARKAPRDVGAVSRCHSLAARGLMRFDVRGQHGPLFPPTTQRLHFQLGPFTMEGAAF